MKQHIMLIPSLACPAGCRYCFGPRQGKATMSLQTLEAAIRCLGDNSNGRPIDITFHGGEPLLAEVAFYRRALPLLREKLGPHNLHLGVQSNLWLLTDELCELFKEHEVTLGTSLDGPEEINDAQRDLGYFQKTMTGIERARSHGLSVGVICTFTAQSAKRAGEVFDFFLREALGFSIHAALPPLGRYDNDYTLSLEEHGRLLVGMLDRYLDNSSSIRISTLDAMCRGISAGKGSICVFGDCLGHYLAVDPDGYLYPCQRLAGMEAFRLGNVRDCPAREDLEKAPVWHAFKERQQQIDKTCSGCPHLAYCRGGCPYNVRAAGGGRFNGDLRDPHCHAYRSTFDRIIEGALAEFFSEENLSAVVAEGGRRYGLLRRGKLLQLVRGGPHPQEAARQARQAVAAVALAVDHTPDAALRRLEQAGVITNPAQALGSLQGLRRHLDTQSQLGLVNAYLHVTSACNLNCTHCYAVSQNPEDATSMAVAHLVDLLHQAAEAGFAKAVITGGEPLVHPQRQTLLDALAVLRQKVKPMQTTLRTNLAYHLTERLVEQLLCSADGNRISHDARRGTGSYDCTVQNLRSLLGQRQENDGHTSPPTQPGARIIIAATLSPSEMEGPQGEAVRALSEELDVPLRFKPVLPLGRGACLGVKPAFYRSLDEDMETLAFGAQPAATCGLGMNLYVGPDGSCYPCYALTASRHYLGNAVYEGMAQVAGRNQAYRQVTENSNAQCRSCALRYLCGGYCRVWSESDEPDAPPPDCTALYQRAERILQTALAMMEVNKEKWQAAGLPFSVK